MRPKYTIALASAALFTLAACGDSTGSATAADGAAKWQYADYMPPTAGFQDAITSHIFEPLEKDGIIETEVFYQESLLAAADILGGVGQGQADWGLTANLYHPSELPLSGLGSVPFMGENAEGQTRAFNELYKTNEAFRAEYDAAGVRVLSFVPLPGSVIGSSVPLNSPDDLANLQVRAAGYLAPAVEASGGNVVAITGPEIYDGMDRGVLDAFTSYPFGSAISVSLGEVAPYMIDPGSGLYMLTVIVVNENSWNALPEESQNALEDLVDGYVEAGLEAIRVEAEESCQIYLDDDGGEIVIWDDAAKTEYRENAGDAAVTAWRDNAIERGVSESDVDEFFAQYEELYAQHDTDFEAGLSQCQ